MSREPTGSHSETTTQDNLANLRMLAGDQSEIPDEELARILRASEGDLTLASHHLLELMNDRELDRQLTAAGQLQARRCPRERAPR